MKVHLEGWLLKWNVCVHQKTCLNVSTQMHNLTVRLKTEGKRTRGRLRKRTDRLHSTMILPETQQVYIHPIISEDTESIME